MTFQSVEKYHHKTIYFLLNIVLMCNQTFLLTKRLLATYIVFPAILRGMLYLSSLFMTMRCHSLIRATESGLQKKSRPTIK